MASILVFLSISETKAKKKQERKPKCNCEAVGQVLAEDEALSDRTPLAEFHNALRAKSEILGIKDYIIFIHTENHSWTESHGVINLKKYFVLI